MAQHKSAKKRIVRNEKRRVINHARISRIRTFVKKVESAIAAGDKDLATQALKIAQPELHRGCLLYTSPSPRDQRGWRFAAWG